jgi:hypothetical protein
VTPYFRLDPKSAKTVRLEKYIRLESRSIQVEYHRIEIDDEREFREILGTESEVEFDETIGIEVVVDERIELEEVIGLEIEENCSVDYNELADLKLD